MSDNSDVPFVTNAKPRNLNTNRLATDLKGPTHVETTKAQKSVRGPSPPSQHNSAESDEESVAYDVMPYGTKRVGAFLPKSIQKESYPVNREYPADRQPGSRSSFDLGNEVLQPTARPQVNMMSSYPLDKESLEGSDTVFKDRREQQQAHAALLGLSDAPGFPEIGAHQEISRLTAPSSQQLVALQDESDMFPAKATPAVKKPSIYSTTSSFVWRTLPTSLGMAMTNDRSALRANLAEDDPSAVHVPLSSNSSVGLLTPDGSLPSLNLGSRFQENLEGFTVARDVRNERSALSTFSESPNARSPGCSDSELPAPPNMRLVKFDDIFQQTQQFAATRGREYGQHAAGQVEQGDATTSILEDTTVSDETIFKTTISAASRRTRAVFSALSTKTQGAKIHSGALDANLGVLSPGSLGSLSRNDESEVSMIQIAHDESSLGSLNITFHSQSGILDFATTKMSPSVLITHPRDEPSTLFRNACNYLDLSELTGSISDILSDLTDESEEDGDILVPVYLRTSLTGSASERYHTTASLEDVQEQLDSTVENATRWQEVLDPDVKDEPAAKAVRFGEEEKRRESFDDWNHKPSSTGAESADAHVEQQDRVSDKHWDEEHPIGYDNLSTNKSVEYQGDDSYDSLHENIRFSSSLRSCRQRRRAAHRIFDLDLAEDVDQVQEPIVGQLLSTTRADLFSSIDSELLLETPNYVAKPLGLPLSSSGVSISTILPRSKPKQDVPDDGEVATSTMSNWDASHEGSYIVQQAIEASFLAQSESSSTDADSSGVSTEHFVPVKTPIITAQAETAQFDDRFDAEPWSIWTLWKPFFWQPHMSGEEENWAVKVTDDVEVGKARSRRVICVLM